MKIIIKKIYISKIMNIYLDLIYTNEYILTIFEEKSAQMNIGKLGYDVRF